MSDQSQVRHEADWRWARPACRSYGALPVYDVERGLHSDYEKWLEGLAPHAPTSPYMHSRTGEDNADAYLKRQVMGREAVAAVTGGRLDFGTWEQIL